MIADGYSAVVSPSGTLPYLDLESIIPTGANWHPVFGAGFLFLGGVLVVESLAGGVWCRSSLRRLLWPACIILLGLGMLLLTYFDPSQKPIHLLLALLLLSGGMFEASHRLRQMPRAAADFLVVPALILGGLLIGPIHGTEMTTASGQTHMLMAASSVGLAGVRVGQAFRPKSAPVAAAFGALVMLLAFGLLLSSDHNH